MINSIAANIVALVRLDEYRNLKNELPGNEAFVFLKALWRILFGK